MDLLLLSNSTNHEGTPLAHARDAVTSLMGERRVLFIPYALADHADYTEKIADAFSPMGLDVTGVHEASDPVAAVAEAEAVYVGGGNSFRLLRTLQHLELLAALRQRVSDGMPYMGASAGTNMACPTIRTTNDMPIVEPASLTALGLISIQINPHYVDPDPSSQHMGESRERRITEFHEENAIPVLGLREGSWLSVTDGRAELLGATARLFRQGESPRELEAGSDLSELVLDS